MPMIKANEIDIYYETHGTGKPLVLIAGYACDHTFWLPVINDLAQYFQVIIFDNRAVGQTKDHNEPLSVELMAEDVVALIKQLELTKPHVVGHSMGGMIARIIAAHYPKRVDKLGLISASMQCRISVLFAMNTMLQMRKDNIEFDLIFKTMLPWIFGDNFLKNQQNIDLLKKAYADNKYLQSVDNQERQLQVLHEFDGRKQLQFIHHSTLVMYGAQDIVTLPSESKWIANKIQDSKLIELDCAHGVVGELPQRFSQELIEFLK